MNQRKHIKLYEEFTVNETSVAIDETIEGGEASLVVNNIYRIYSSDGRIFSSGSKYMGRDAQGEKFMRLNVPKPKPYYLSTATFMTDYIFYKTRKIK